MVNAKRFKFLEHTADAYVEAHGKDLEEAFENSALAMFHVMTDTRGVARRTEDAVQIEAADEQALLYSWLETLLVKFDTDETLYSEFKVEKIEKTPKGLRLKAKIWGEKFDPGKHLQKVGVKAATYHLMEIVRKDSSVTLRFILDI